MNFAKFVRTPFSAEQHWTIASDYIAVSIVVKGELANETVNYDRKRTLGVLKNFVNSTRENIYVLVSFNKVAGRPAAQLKGDFNTF